MFEGVTTTVGDRELVVPRVPLKAFRLHPEWFEKLDHMSGTLKPEDVGNLLDIIHSALERNYPDMSLDAVETLLDINNVSKLLLLVMGQSTGEAERL